jgi:hypothetical protein
MSSRTLNFIDRLRSKSFDKAIISGNNLASYHFVENFDNITEEECLKIDTKNKEIYKKNIDLYENISKQIENKNAMFKIDSPPLPPPEPNNYDRFIANRIRNVTRNVKHQSYAVNYLLNKGYKLIVDPAFIKTDTKTDTKTENEFEPFEAIDICEKLENMTIENILKREFPSVKNSPNVYNNRKSMNLNIVHQMPSGYHPVYPVYPNDYSYYQNYQNYPNSTPNTPLSVSAPSFIQTFQSPPSAPIIDPSQTIQQKQIINAPPASHYIHKS